MISISTILLTILLLMLLGALRTWPHSRNWGYYPSGGLLTIMSAGCGETSSTTKETKITTPGGTTTIKTEQEVKKTGENPPATP